MGNETKVTLADLRKVLDFAADALDMIDLTCNDSATPGGRCEECGSCAGYFALQWARQILARTLDPI